CATSRPSAAPARRRASTNLRNVGIDELLCHRDPGLEFPHLDVGVGSFCRDCDSGPYMVGFCGLQFIQSSSFPPAQTARKVRLPARRWANRIFSEIPRVAGEAAANYTKLIRGTLTLSRSRRIQIGGWQKLSTSLRRSRPCLRYTVECSGKVQ